MTGDITMLHATAMSGPEFLDSYADQSRASGLDINADVFRTRAQEWAHDKRVIAGLREELQAANDRLAEVRRLATVL